MPRLSRLVRVRFKVRPGISAKVIFTAALSQSSSCEDFMRAYLGNIVPQPGRGLPNSSTDVQSTTIGRCSFAHPAGKRILVHAALKSRERPFGARLGKFGLLVLTRIGEIDGIIP